MKIVIITGASRGLGARSALQCPIKLSCEDRATAPYFSGNSGKIIAPRLAA